MPAETVLAATGIASQGAGTVMSFIQSGKERQMRIQAEKDAEEYYQKARKELGTNYYEGLSLPKEPYELEREALIASGAQALEAGREAGARGVASTAGRVQMAHNEGQGQIRSAMAKDEQQLDILKAQGAEKVARTLGNLDVEQSVGAQAKAREAWMGEQQAINSGVKGISNLVGSAASFIPLYQKGQSGKLLDEMKNEFSVSGTEKVGDFLAGKDPNLSFLKGKGEEAWDYIGNKDYNWMKSFYDSAFKKKPFDLYSEGYDPMGESANIKVAGVENDILPSEYY
ncbi:MAG: hypothetical protein WCY09_08570 [Candidatus Omnitrophota bacterium]|jgi:hypothetical protein